MTISKRFDSVSELVAFAMGDYHTTTQDAIDMHGKRNAITGPSDAKWFGIKPGDVPNQRAASMAAQGWPEGVERIRAALNNLGEIAAPVSIKRRRVWADQGDSVDMGKVWAGNCESAWSRTQRSTARAPAIVTIWTPSSIVHTADADSLFWRGAAVVAVTDSLTTAGYSVGINMFKHDPICAKLRSNSTKKHRGAIVELITTVKRSDTPLDISTLAASVANPCFIRAICYEATQRAACEAGEKVWHGLSYSDNQEPPCKPESDLGNLFDVVNKASAKHWCNDIMRRFGAVDLAA